MELQTFKQKFDVINFDFHPNDQKSKRHGNLS